MNTYKSKLININILLEHDEVIKDTIKNLLMQKKIRRISHGVGLCGIIKSSQSSRRS